MAHEPFIVTLVEAVTLNPTPAETPAALTPALLLNVLEAVAGYVFLVPKRLCKRRFAKYVSQIWLAILP